VTIRRHRLMAAALVAAAWLFGLLSFVRADGHFEATLPRRRPEPAGPHNLSAWDMGPTVRASSFYYHWARLIEALYGLERAQ